MNSGIYKLLRSRRLQKKWIFFLHFVGEGEAGNYFVNMLSVRCPLYTQRERASRQRDMKSGFWRSGQDDFEKRSSPDCVQCHEVRESHQGMQVCRVDKRPED